MESQTPVKPSLCKVNTNLTQTLIKFILNFFYFQLGNSQNPGLIPRTLDTLFERLRSSLETKRAIYQFKPEKFNEISSLNDSELNTELAFKEQLFKMSNFKEMERVESCESLTEIESGSIDSSKKFGSLDSLSSILYFKFEFNNLSILNITFVRKVTQTPV